MKISLLAITITFFLSACSNTWEGVKNDSSTVWEDTKDVIHEATE